VKPPAFEYRRPETLEEAVGLLAEHGDEARILAGGQSLVPLLSFRMARPGLLIDINRCLELDHIELDDGRLAMGSLTRHRSVERLAGLSDRCPVMMEAVRQIGHVAIRNRGTVGGSIAHADPAAEWPLLALVLDARFEVTSARGTRAIPAQEMFSSYLQTSIGTDEILTRLEFPLPPLRAGSAFVEIARRHGDFAMSGAAAVIDVEDGKVVDARVGLMSAALTPVRAAEAESILIGHEPTDDVLGRAAAAVDGAIAPLDDVHASAEYKRHLAQITTKRALTSARDRARGAG